jgi:DNA mismatch repair protein MutL
MPDTDAPPRIQILPDVLSNQIAAGEVIERPASVVKELVENSLDAKATKIEVDIEHGGTRLIRVIDNGHGIHADDMRLALESHATSKLHRQSDLFRIRTLGFRGEALPSIASVARLEIISRIATANTGWLVRCDPATGDSISHPAAYPPGTSVVVRELFHVIPARRKFLRTDRTEFIQIQEMIRRLALGCFDTAIKLAHNGKPVFACKPDSGRQGTRLSAVMGSAFTEQAMKLDCSSERMRLWGWTGSALMHRSQVDRQYFYLNGRMIRDKNINHAIRLAYDDQIPDGRYPVYVLYLEMDPALADVNVHPSKYEVRFTEARNVHDFVYGSIRNTLQKVIQHSGLIRDTVSSYASATGQRAGYPHTNTVFPPRRGGQTGYGFKATAGKHPENESIKYQQFKFHGDIQGRFILAEKAGSLMLIDIQGAKRHIARYRLLQASRLRPLPSRPLLVPITIRMSEIHADLAGQFRDLLRQYGLEMEAAGPGAMLIRSIPLILENADLQALIRDLSVVLQTSGKSAGDLLAQEIIRILENHAGAEQHATLDAGAISHLLNRLSAADIDLEQPHHAGIWRTLAIKDIETVIRHGI